MVLRFCILGRMLPVGEIICCGFGENFYHDFPKARQGILSKGKIRLARLFSTASSVMYVYHFSWQHLGKRSIRKVNAM